MSTITVRLNEDEQKIFDEYAKLQETPLSTLMKQSLEERIEDELDLKAIKDYEERLQKDEIEVYDYDEVKKMLGL